MPSFGNGSPAFGSQGMVRNPSRLRQVTNVESEATLDSVLDNLHQDDNAPLDMATDPTQQDEFSEYARALMDGNSEEVFGDNGLLSRFYLICQAKIEHLQVTGTDDDDPALKSAQLEARTWDLVQRLYIERTKGDDSAPRVSPIASNRALVQHLYDTNNELAESKIVLDWLHDGYTPDVVLDIRSNRWFYTKEAIKARQRGLHGASNQSIVDSLDPDASTRQGKRLTEEDAEYERNLVKSMFQYVRAGDYSRAADLARRSGEHWRAANLQGCVEQYDSRLDGDFEDDKAVQIEGTDKKPLWRRMCFALSQQTCFDTYERALYGALAGDVATLLPVLHSWEDHVWAHFNAMNLSKVEARLRVLGRVDTELDFAISDYSHLMPHNVLEALLQSSEPSLSTEARVPLRIVQARLITNQISDLFVDVHRQLLSIQHGGLPGAGTTPSFLRFIVHFILLLRKLNIAVPEDSANAIIQAYVEILTAASEGGAVALYASQLAPSDTVEALARYFVTVHEEADRKTQLEIAKQFGIDVGLTILRAVELTFEQILSNLTLGEGIRNINTDVDSEEERCVRALEWLNLDDGLQQEAILLGNNLFRKFLLSGRTSAAKILALRMPDTKLVPIDLMLDDGADSQSEEANSQMRNAIEYVGYCTLIKALAKYEDWKALIREKPQEVNGRRDPVGLRQWKSDLSRLKSECIVVMKEILDGNWCDAIELGITDQVVIDEMLNLRTMYVADSVLKLHGVYAAHEGRDVAAAMDLAVLVAENLTLPMKQSGLLPTYVSEVAMLGAYLA